MDLRWWCGVATACALSCSGETESGGTAGSGGNDSGPTPPPAEGGMYLRIFPGSTTEPGAACLRTTGHDARIPSDGYPTAAGIGPFGQDRTGTPAIDGLNGTAVACAVQGRGPFHVSANIESNGISLVVQNGSLTLQGDGTASIASFDPVGQAMQSPAEAPCAVTPLQIQPGAVWASLRCARYQDPAAPTQTACAAEGVFLFQNCDL